VDLKQCKIPEFPITSLKKIALKRTKLENCESKNFLTSIVSTQKDDDPLFITIHPDNFQLYQVSSAECCYHNISRIFGNDGDVKLSKNCKPFGDKHELSKEVEHILVKCSSDGNIIYSNVHAIIAQRHEFAEREKLAKIDKKKAFKVLMVGVDSISRMGLERGMPQSRKIFADQNQWFEMKGYTRVSIHLLHYELEF
jgi:Protein of unknown function (DUF229)